MRAIYALLGGVAVFGGGLYLYNKNKTPAGTTPPGGTPPVGGKTPPKGAPAVDTSGGLVITDPKNPEVPNLEGRVLPAAQATALENALVDYKARSTKQVMSATDILVTGSPIQGGETTDGAERLSSQISSFTAAGALVFVDPQTAGALALGTALPFEIKLRFMLSSDFESVKDALISGWYLFRKPAV